MNDKIIHEWSSTDDGQLRCHVMHLKKNADVVANSIGRTNAHDMSLGRIHVKPGQLGVLEETEVGVVVAFGSNVESWKTTDLRWLDFSIDKP